MIATITFFGYNFDTKSNRTKKVVFFALLAFLSFTFKAQDCYWLHGSNSSTAGDDGGKDIATDAVGNVYVIGDYSGSAMVPGTTHLAKGSYFVHLLSDKGNAVRKTVIE